MSVSSQRESIYQPSQSGLKFPEIPEFSSPSEHRDYLKRRLVAACRAFGKHNLDYGMAGHLTVRDPEYPQLYWTNPMAVHFNQVKVSNLICANHKGEVVEGDYAINRAGFVLHAAVHEDHPDIVSMCHAHTVYGTAWATTGRLLDPISQDAAAFYDDHAVITEEAGKVSVEVKAGCNFSSALKDKRAIIHRNHGLLTVSRHSIDAAAFWFIALERCCQQQLLIEAAGVKPIQLTEEVARYSQKHVGSEYIGWLHFQSIYDDLVKTSPDMFD